jgi:hypothetical protein
MSEHMHQAAVEPIHLPVAASVPIHGRLSDGSPLTIAFALYECDPFAVSMVIAQGPLPGRVEQWKFDRDLLSAVFDPACAGRVGELDVRLSFDLDQVRFDFHGVEGWDWVTVPATDLAVFVRLMGEALPLERAAELRAFDLDRFLGALLWDAS